MRRLLSIILVSGLVLLAGVLVQPGAPRSADSTSALGRATSAPSLTPTGPLESPSTTGGPDVTQTPDGTAPSPTPQPSPAYVAKPIEFGGTLSLTPGTTADLSRGHFGANAGQALIQHGALPAPWAGGSAAAVDVVVRLPPNYDPVHKRYPVVYETPSIYNGWAPLLAPGSAYAHLEQIGSLPPTIFVFAGAIGGPYPITWCIDSKDGRQHWDTFMSTTLVAWVDSHYATIADPAARTIMGSSQGGYCSADLLVRHPDVWHQEISFDGLYNAPPRNAHTLAGQKVFGGDQALMDAYSPIQIAPQIPVETRQHLFFILLGLSAQHFYGPQMDGFTAVLDQNGYGRAVIESPFGHAWATVQRFMVRALLLNAARMVQQGVLR